MLNIALLSPYKNSYSETFIQQHRLNITGNVIYYFNGNIPKENNCSGILLTNSVLIKLRIQKGFKKTKFSLNELALINSFKKEKINVVVAEYGTTAADVLRVCEFLNLPLIPIFHGYDASIKKILNIYNKKYNLLFNYVKKIIVVSKEIKKTLISLGCKEEKIIITPCAPNDEFFNLKPSFNNQCFFGVGRFVDKKAPYYTILAFHKILRQFPKAQLVLAGDGPLYNVCFNLIKTLNISKNVKLLGKISPKEIKIQLLASVGFVQHSIIALDGDSEGTPVSILEASAAGLPIISTFHAGIPDVVKNNETGFLVKEHDVNGMSKKMILLLKDIKKSEEMGLAGKDYVFNSFRKSIHIEKINKVIKDVCNE